MAASLEEGEREREKEREREREGERERERETEERVSFLSWHNIKKIIKVVESVQVQVYRSMCALCQQDWSIPMT